MATLNNDYNPFLDTELMKECDMMGRKFENTLKAQVVKLPLAEQIKMVEFLGVEVKAPRSDNQVWQAIDVLAARYVRQHIELTAERKAGV